MRIGFAEISNFRKLKSTRVDFDKETTIFVGANNSGKTSAMTALRYFLILPKRLALRDITIANWTKIDALGDAWEANLECSIVLDDLLPSLDIWLDVPLSEIQHVVHILPTLDWNGGLLGVRLKYKVEDLDKLRFEYLSLRAAAREGNTNTSDAATRVQVWPKCLTDFLERRLHSHVELSAFSLDPSAIVPPDKGFATPQLLSATALPLEKNPFKRLIKINEIAAQRDFADAGEQDNSGEDDQDIGLRRFKRRLSDQLRSYYDRHLDPTKMPSAEDYEALGAIQTAERNFDRRLEASFAAAFEELEDLGYPGITNPKLKISTKLHAADGLKHRSAVQYQVADPTGDGTKTLKLPEDYSGLGYQNLIAMVFMLMGYRDEWMRVGKASVAESNVQEQIQPLHLVLVEEPEVHLHAQVQQVFIKKAYALLRKHPELGEHANFSTQLVVSTHSSHVAHEADFANLRYFRRRPASSKGEIPTTTVTNLSFVFGEGDETLRFVKRYLKVTHCDIFFADGIIFVEGQAERILVPHFIRQYFPSLSRRYVTLLDLGGSHAHSFKKLIDELGLSTLIIADLDATEATEVEDKKGKKVTRWKAAKPALARGQKTANPVLKEWYPAKESIDELIALKPLDHMRSMPEGYELYVAYQKPISDSSSSGGVTEVIPRTFEDAFVLENRAALSSISGSPTSDRIQSIVAAAISGQDLVDELFQLLKSAEKAAFALDCLMLDDEKAIKPPTYIKNELGWFEQAVGRDIHESEPGAAQ
ncbi:MAG: AAA family ATPase [Cyanobacteria bacterium SZAS TMP-1]|nr:AAA family ATPase [Cyanobacteria bacterium SZAS TMP-1]